jgi:cell wall-associated NlpC family hydrolase
LPRTVAEQFGAGVPVRRDALDAGDLVFFTTTGPGATHVGIVTGAAAGEFVHAPADDSSVRVDRLDAAYWRARWLGARRVISSAVPSDRE